MKAGLSYEVAFQALFFLFFSLFLCFSKKVISRLFFSFKKKLNWYIRSALL